MKKFISLVLVLALCAFVFVACGEKKEDAKLTILDTEYVEEDYAICVAKEDTELLEKINVALKELEADGTKQAIIDKYISAE